MLCTKPSLSPTPSGKASSSSSMVLTRSRRFALPTDRWLNNVCGPTRSGLDVTAMIEIRSRSWTSTAVMSDPQSGENPHTRWRPFQLAFVLLNLAALADPTHHSRSSADAPVDLLFFPTGGGKTEAYLGLVAATFALRRLQPSLGDVDGVRWSRRADAVHAATSDCPAVRACRGAGVRDGAHSAQPIPTVGQRSVPARHVGRWRHSRRTARRKPTTPSTSCVAGSARTAARHISSPSAPGVAKARPDGHATAHPWLRRPRRGRSQRRQAASDLLP